MTRISTRCSYPIEWTRYEISVLLPAGSAPGTWGLAEITLRDKASNIASFSFTELIHFDVE